MKRTNWDGIRVDTDKVWLLHLQVEWGFDHDKFHPPHCIVGTLFYSHPGDERPEES